MRIFSAVRHSANPQYYYGALWADNFHPALRRLGHEVVESQIDLLPASRFMDAEKPFTPQEQAVRSDLTEQIIDEIRKAHQERPIDLVLTYFYDSHFNPAGFSDIRQLGIPTVNFYCNSIYQFELVSEVSAAVDFAWHAERDAEPKYRAIGANPIWIQMAADPSVYHPIENTPRKPAACFVGQCYADRARWIASLVQAGIPLALHGAGWKQTAASQPTARADKTDPGLGRRASPVGSIRSYINVIQGNLRHDGIARGTARALRQANLRRNTRAYRAMIAPLAGSRITFSEMLQLFSESEVVLNFSNVWSDGRPGSKLIPHVRLRDFEAPMCRSCYLTGDTDEIREFYEVGREIDTYRTTDELIGKTRFYLRTPDAAERLREAGYQRAIADHTWDQRFQKLLRVIDPK